MAPTHYCILRLHIVEPSAAIKGITIFLSFLIVVQFLSLQIMMGTPVSGNSRHNEYCYIVLIWHAYEYGGKKLF
jgi:hypothetical protein